MQVTPSVTPTSSLSSSDTRSTYAINNVIRGTPNSRNSVVDGHSDMAATMRGSLALDPGLFGGRRNYSPAVAAAATYDAARRANPYSVYQRRPEHFEYRSSVASAASSGGEAAVAVPPSAAAMGEHWPKSATLRAMPLAAMGQQQPQLGRSSTSGQFHNMVHLQNPMAAATVSSPGGGGLYTLRRNSLHEYGGGGVVGASSNGGVGTGSLMRCTTNGGTGSLQKVKRVYI